MKARSWAMALWALGAAQMVHAAMPTAQAMRWHRRIVLIAAPDRHDRQAAEQRRILDDWRREAADRDIALVEIAGAQVTGLADAASTLRHRYAIAPGRFQVLLIGKDGTVALRSAQPIPASTLQGAIDAMPMRKAGGR